MKDELRDRILEVLQDHKLSRFHYEDGGNYALVDLLTPDGSGSIQLGVDALIVLADEIAIALQPKEERLAGASKLLKRFESEFEATGPNDATLLRDYYQWTGEPHYQGEYGWNHGRPDTSGPDAEEVLNSVNQEKAIGEIVSEGLQDFVAGPFGCRCTTLQQRVTGDGCDMCTDEKPYETPGPLEEALDSLLDMFTQHCISVHAPDGSTRYHHGCLSANRCAQDVLLKHGILKEGELAGR